MSIVKDAYVVRKRLTIVPWMGVEDIENAFFLIIEMATGGLKMAVNEPFYECPRYDRCSVNACPLDPDYPRYTDEMDTEQICKLGNEEKIKIMSKFPNILKLMSFSDIGMKTQI